jgi:hypothetical protein
VAADVFIAGGSADTVGTLTIQNSGSYGVYVGGSPSFGGTGNGTLTATTINDTSGALVSAAGSTIQATSIVGTNIGGGGTFTAGSINDSGGSIIADGQKYGLGPLVLNGGSIIGSGFIEVIPGSTLELGDATSQNIDIYSKGKVSTVQLDSVGSFTGTIDIPIGTILDIVLAGGSITDERIVASSTIVVTQGGTTESFRVADGGSVVFNSNLVLSSTAPVCFARGTCIATPDGDAAIEDLNKGDLVLTASGNSRPVVWIGHRRADCSRHPDPRRVWPILIQAAAFGPGLPARDLRVSPQHGIFAEGVLIPAKVLVNGTTIRQEKVASIEYFHVELESHDILLADGLPAESYLDAGDRSSFENGGSPVALYPDFARFAWDARGCADLKIVGTEVECVRAQLASQVATLQPAQRAMATA